MNLLIAVPLLALVAASALGYLALERSSVRGDEYKALKQAQDLRADVLPPPASLLDAWAEVNEIAVLAASSEAFSATGLAAIDDHLLEIQRIRAAFDGAMTYWSQQDLDQRVRIRLIDIGGDAGAKFFKQIDDELIPALERHDAEAVISIVRSLEWRFELQQTGVERALRYAESEVLNREQSTNDYVHDVIILAGSGSAAILLLTLLMSVFVRRSIVSPIRRLAARAKAVATTELPQVVQHVQELEPGSPVPHLADFDLGTRDELAELGTSFNSVQDAAVDLAFEQAMARRVVSENLVNIARRNQNLLGRTLGFISSLEQGERDPESLDNLFRLDHLTTRMRRNAQSLLVLAGAEPTRLWAPTVAIGDVVRAALSEVENYGQVELAVLGDIGVQGAVASEIAHLLAELLENATSFSPPNSPVTVVGRTVPDGQQLAIFDYGLGMSAEDLADANRRLNQVSSFDQESNKKLGFQVVSRLAARHNVKVMLTTTPGGTGVTAIVRLPKAILEAVAAPGSSVPALNVPEMSQRLSEPLDMRPGHESTTPSGSADEALWSAMSRSVESGHLPLDAPSLMPTSTPVLSSTPASAGDGFADTAELEALSKRVPGAQLPDGGRSASEATVPRPAEEVRSSLASLQRGVDLGRRHTGEAE